MAWCQRFIQRARKQHCSSGSLTTRENEDALKKVIQLVQRKEFDQEIQKLQRGERLPKNSIVLKLSPFIEDDLLRVGGRIRRAETDYEHRHLILLPKKHPFTDLVIRYEHERHLHAGASGTLCAIRQRYWPIQGRMSVRSIVHSCVQCFRATPRVPEYVMGDLPRVRVVSGPPFSSSGVDYCGPFYVKEKKHRNRGRVKVYAAVFVCMSIKAVHIELISDLTSESFIAGLRRFFSRRGKAQAIYSDNGKNFVGADNELKELYDLLNSEQHNEKIKSALVDLGIEWHFSPPRTPHFGGIWEAAVRSFKLHMRRTVGETLFTYEELNTLMCEIEAVLYSRPLVPLSSDPNDLFALTLGHFIVGRALTTVPMRNYAEIPINRLSAWQHVQKQKLDFWTRWHREYLSELNIKSKWNSGSPELIKVGTLVLLIDDDLPPLRWNMGRIIETHPGEDGIIRVVSVKTISGIFKRGVKKIAPLPIET